MTSKKSASSAVAADGACGSRRGGADVLTLPPLLLSRGASLCGHLGRQPCAYSEASYHRPSSHVSGSAVRNRDPPIRDFFQKPKAI
jgi:hypothetical protein